MEMKREDSKILVEEDEIMREIESFYENLYALHDEDNSEAFNDFVACTSHWPSDWPNHWWPCMVT